MKARGCWFDAHCDTVLKLPHADSFLRRESGRHVSLPGLVEANVRAQVFACCVRESECPGHADARAEELLDLLEQVIAYTEGELCLARTGEDVLQAFTGGARAAILSLEGADPLGCRAEAIRSFFQRGVRSLIFAWEENAFSGTAMGRNLPLTPQGRRLLGLCEELGVVVDVSHLSDAAFDEVAELSEKPFVATHSNCRAICPSPRNLTDQQIRAIADRGGVIGINLCPSFLDPSSLAATDRIRQATNPRGATERERTEARKQVSGLPRPSLAWVIRHIRHAMDVGGEDCVGMGGDLDGILMTPQGMESVSDLPKLLPLLQEAGCTETQIGKLMHGNFLRVFSEGLPRVEAAPQRV